MISHLSKSLTYAFVASVTTVCMLMMAFFIAEPAMSHGQEAFSNDFTIRQTITDENSFKTVGNVIMDGDINGVTGGTANGATQFVVISNNAAGYTVEIDFDYDAGNDEAMVGDESGSEAIRDYGGDAAGPQPSFAFTASSAAQFAYTVTSSSSAHTAQSFLSNGGLCNIAALSSGVQVDETCWKAPQPTGFTVVDTAEAATAGATSTLQFRVVVPGAAVPIPLAETYTATATLSLFIK